MQTFFRAPWLWISALAVLASCGSGSESGNTQPANNSSNRSSYFSFSEPARGSLYTWGEEIPMTVSAKPGAPAVDSVEYFVDRVKVGSSSGTTFGWSTEGATVGRKVLVAVVHAGGEKQQARVSTTLKSNLTPDTYGYQVVARFPHDPAAYTQGLEIHGGYLYEGTGKEGESNVRKVDLRTGAVVLQKDLDDHLFGEGITRVGDQIYQLTWKARLGYVYDMNTFEEVRQFNYPTEGWGLVYDGERLIMSDGTAKLQFLDPSNFQNLGSMDVYDDKGGVKNLNELELIDGELYANIWMTDLIAKIDPATGRVLAYIDLTGLLPTADRTNTSEVLNGIAHDAATGRTYLTGKYWPFLYEVQFVPQSVN